MTISETLIAAVAGGLLLLAVALGLSWIRAELKQRRTHELLLALDEALRAYHASAGAWPDRPRSSTSAPAQGTPTALNAAQQCAAQLLAQLRTHDASRAVLDRVPGVLWLPADCESHEGMDAEQGHAILRDAWGTPLGCLTRTSAREMDRLAVAANGGCPVWLSAGPDGRFGREDPAAAADNIQLQPTPRR